MVAVVSPQFVRQTHPTPRLIGHTTRVISVFLKKQDDFCRSLERGGGGFEPPALTTL